MSKTQTFKYCCKNDDCEVAWKDFTHQSTKEVSDKGIACEVCGVFAKRMGVVAFGGNLRITKLPPNEKQKIMKKRSKEHSAKSRDTFYAKGKADYIP